MAKAWTWLDDAEGELNFWTPVMVTAAASHFVLLFLLPMLWMIFTAYFVKPYTIGAAGGMWLVTTKTLP